MPYSIFDYVDARGYNDFQEWWLGLQKPERGKLRGKIAMLERYGEELFPDVLTGTPIPGIMKLRVHGPVQLRPLLCRGPGNVATEYTMLKGATERDSVFDPIDAPNIADDRRNVVINEPKRRTVHVRVTK